MGGHTNDFLKSGITTEFHGIKYTDARDHAGRKWNHVDFSLSFTACASLPHTHTQVSKSALGEYDTDLHFVRVPSDSQGLVHSCWHGTILDHDHLNSCSLLEDTNTHTQMNMHRHKQTHFA